MSKYFDRRHSVVNNFNSPHTIQEIKAPTDDSVRLLNEMQEKARQNILFHIKVDDNLVKGDCICIKTMMDVVVSFKFKINGKEFLLEKRINPFEFDYSSQKEIDELRLKTKSEANGIMLWYALRMLSVQAFEQITGERYPDYALKRL